MKYIYSYTISMEASHDVFVDALRKIDEHYPDFKGGYGVGGFGSFEEAKYEKDNDFITLTNDYDIDAVYIDSTVELLIYKEFRNYTYEKKVNNLASHYELTLVK